MALFLVDPTTQGKGTGKDNSGIVQTLLCVDAVAHLLSVSPQTVYKWVRTGYIPHFKLGKCVRFSQPAVLQWLAERESQGRTTRVPILEEMQ